MNFGRGSRRKLQQKWAMGAYWWGMVGLTLQATLPSTLCTLSWMLKQTRWFTWNLVTCGRCVNKMLPRIFMTVSFVFVLICVLVDIQFSVTFTCIYSPSVSSWDNSSKDLFAFYRKGWSQHGWKCLVPCEEWSLSAMSCIYNQMNLCLTLAPLCRQQLIGLPSMHCKLLFIP